MYMGSKGDSHEVEEVLEDAKIYINIYVSTCSLQIQSNKVNTWIHKIKDFT